MKSSRSYTGSSLSFNIFIMAVFVTIAVGSIILLRTELLNGAQNTGTALARLYAIEEQSHIEVYENLLTLGTQYLDERVEQGYTGEELTNWMRLFFDSVSEYLGGIIIDPYVVVDGHIYAANPWERDKDYDAASTEWYANAIAADG